MTENLKYLRKIFRVKLIEVTVASKLYRVNAGIIIFVFLVYFVVMYCEDGTRP